MSVINNLRAQLKLDFSVFSFNRKVKKITKSISFNFKNFQDLKMRIMLIGTKCNLFK